MLAILADIHGNLPALTRVIEDMERYPVEGVVLLGDLIDYGMQSNEVVSCVRDTLQDRVISAIWGNHERAVCLGDFTRFSSQRGVDSARHTASQLTPATRAYLDSRLDHSGCQRFERAGRKFLAVHGSLEDAYWKAIAPDNLRGDYSDFDVVLSGHSHYAHMFTHFYACEDARRRNQHAVLFINPGSVGQPRNHNPAAQYALLDTGTMAVSLRAVDYDRQAAMALFDGSKDDFYRARLEYGV